MLLISDVLDKARELKQKMFEAKHRDWLEEKPITESITPELVKEVKTHIPPKPEMPPEAMVYPKLKKIDIELKQQNRIIFEAERERGLLEIERSDLKGLAKLTRKSELDKKIALKNEEILKKGLSGIAKRYGFANMHEFYNTLRTSEDAYRKYQSRIIHTQAVIETEGRDKRPSPIYIKHIIIATV